jgi:hypothetical protein
MPWEAFLLSEFREKISTKRKKPGLRPGLNAKDKCIKPAYMSLQQQRY